MLSTVLLFIHGNQTLGFSRIPVHACNIHIVHTKSCLVDTGMHIHSDFILGDQIIHSHFALEGTNTVHIAHTNTVHMYTKNMNARTHVN